MSSLDDNLFGRGCWGFKTKLIMHKAGFMGIEISWMDFYKDKGGTWKIEEILKDTTGALHVKSE